jgi:hypothetical protein
VTGIMALEVRDRWFHGIHAHSLPAPGPAGTSSVIVSQPLASHDELVKLDVYGTLKEKHVRLTRAQLRLMYTEVRERTDRTLAGMARRIQSRLHQHAF